MDGWERKLGVQIPPRAFCVPRIAGAGFDPVARPLPAWLHPFYFELVAGMMACLLVVLPAAVWLQVFCACLVAFGRGSRGKALREAASRAASAAMTRIVVAESARAHRYESVSR